MEDTNRIVGDGYVEYKFCTPAGEDFSFTIPITGDEPHEVYKYAENFDVDEHVELWINERGRNGVPATIRVLVEDAEWIKDRLLILAEEINNELE